MWRSRTSSLLTSIDPTPGLSPLSPLSADRTASGFNRQKLFCIVRRVCTFFGYCVVHIRIRRDISLVWRRLFVVTKNICWLCGVYRRWKVRGRNAEGRALSWSRSHLLLPFARTYIQHLPCLLCCATIILFVHTSCAAVLYSNAFVCVTTVADRPANDIVHRNTVGRHDGRQTDPLLGQVLRRQVRIQVGRIVPVSIDSVVRAPRPRCSVLG